MILGYSKCNNNNIIMIIMIIMWHSAQNKSPFKKKMLTKLKLFCQKLFKISHEMCVNEMTSNVKLTYTGASRWLIPLDLYWTCQLRLVVLVEELRFCVSRSRELLWRINLDMQLFQWQLIHSAAASRRTNGSLLPSCRGLNELNCLSGFSSAA